MSTPEIVKGGSIICLGGKEVDSEELGRWRMREGGGGKYGIQSRSRRRLDTNGEGTS
jgi:hypothetical protein